MKDPCAIRYLIKCFEPLIPWVVNDQSGFLGFRDRIHYVQMLRAKLDPNSI